ncbi:putative structural protein [Wenzhou shrimp virus 3]|uniref:putative structural protein n=1 Tax=Wenzhou shrimp virus 3 TaxID=1923650 RepID=UPI00090952E3|nr:putative structural protein [Wenzhou shrimp virus 3]APG77706.1 putative structural protein [Wenzhou shrimp virus 3]
MDLTKPQKSDGTSIKGSVTLSSPNDVATYTFNVVQSVRLTNASKVGEPLLNIPLDVNLDPTLPKIAQAYERYSLKNVKLMIQSGSPLGTSSGCAQIAHIPDPENAALPAGGGEAACKKIVRQAGSTIIRPRDSDVFTVPLHGEMYTKLSGSRRWSSFGNIVAVVRSTPEASDWAEWSMTLTGNVEFYRTAVIDDSSTFFNYDVLLSNPVIDGHHITFESSAEIPGCDGQVKFLDSMTVAARDGNITKPFKLITQPATFAGKSVRITTSKETVRVLTPGLKLARLLINETSCFY